MDDRSLRSGGKASHARFLILGLVCLATFVNYLDRSNLAVAAPVLSKDLNLSPAVMGIIFSAFGWSYAAAQIPCAWFIDRVGPRVVYAIALAGWSTMTGLIGFANSVGALIGCRVGLGTFEAPAFPCNNRIVTAWFPSKERGKAIGAYTAAEYVGLAFCTPILAWIIVRWSWHAIFFATGVLGLIVTALWWFAYRDPSKHPKANRVELDYIHEGGGLSDKVVEKKKVTWKEMRHLFRHRQLWGMYIGQFANTSTLFFFMTWFPSYLVTEKHMTLLKAGWYGAVPYAAAIVGVLVGGFWSDSMIRAGRSIGLSRKLPTIVGLLLSTSIIGANYTNDFGTVILFMSIAFLGQGIASAVAWALLSDIAPKELVGMTSGVFNFAANLGGTLSPLAIGFIVNYTHSFSAALIFAASLALVGALSYIFVVGKTSRIELPKEA